MRSLHFVWLAGFALAACDTVPDGHKGMDYTLVNDKRVYDGEVVNAGTEHHRHLGLVDCRPQDRRERLHAATADGGMISADVRIAFRPDCREEDVRRWLTNFDEDGNRSVTSAEIYEQAVRPLLVKAISSKAAATAMAEFQADTFEHGALRLWGAVLEEMKASKPPIELTDVFDVSNVAISNGPAGGPSSEQADGSSGPTAETSKSDDGPGFLDWGMLLVILICCSLILGIAAIRGVPLAIKAFERLAADRQARKAKIEAAAAANDVVRILMTDRALAEETRQRLDKELVPDGDPFRSASK